MLAHWLIDVDDFASPDSLALFQKELPLEWINKALDETNKASMRRRKLPAELVVWLLVGIGLYRDRPITDVLDKLDLKLSNYLTSDLHKRTFLKPSNLNTRLFGLERIGNQSSQQVNHKTDATPMP